MKKFNKIWLIVGLLLAAALLIGGVVFIIKGMQMPDVTEDINDFIGQGSRDATDFVLGGFLLFAGVGIGAITLYLGIGHRVRSSIKEKGGLGKVIGQTIKDIDDAQAQYCPYCGTKIDLGETKCSNCGASVTKEE